MADVGYGQLVGKVDVTFNLTTDNDNNQGLFTSIYRFLNGPMRSSSYAELVALQYGASSNGTNYADENNPFGQNAFFCFRIPSGSNAGGTSQRQHDYYIFCQWADSTTFGSSPGNPGLINATTGDGCGIAFAMRDDGGNPWNGTTNADGTDTKGTPVWSAGGASTTLRCFPISNNDLNTHAPSKQNTFRLGDIDGSEASICRFFGLADRDNFLIMFDETDDGDTENAFFIGMYEPLDQLTGSTGMPIVIYGEDSALAWDIPDNTTIGTTTGNSTFEGLIIGPSGSTTLSGSALRFNSYTSLVTNALLQPNTLIVPGEFATYQPAVSMYQTPDFGHAGYLSKFFQLSGQVSKYVVNAASSSAVFSNSPRLIVPWSGSAPRTTSFGRNGREFSV